MSLTLKRSKNLEYKSRTYRNEKINKNLSKNTMTVHDLELCWPKFKG